MNKLFACMSFPRGGTHFVAKVMQQFGFDVKHEAMGKDGACDWRIILLLDKRINSYDDNLVFQENQANRFKNQFCIFQSNELIQYFSIKKLNKSKLNKNFWRKLLKKLYNIKFKYKLFFIRNPWHTLSTWIQLYNFPDDISSLGVMVYYSRLGKNKYDFKNSFERACEMYIEYGNLMKKYCDKIIKIENIEEELKLFFNEKKIKFNDKVKLTRDFIAKTPFHNKRIPKEEIKKNISSILFYKLQNFINSIYKNE